MSARSGATVGGLRAAFGASSKSVEPKLEHPVAHRGAISVTALRPTRAESAEDASCRDKKDLEAGIAELRRLLAADCTVGSPPPSTFFGVSPPERSAAANPMPQDSRWRREPALVSSRSLQTLHELDCHWHFMRSDWSMLGAGPGGLAGGRACRSPLPHEPAEPSSASSACSAGSRASRHSPVPPRPSSSEPALLAC
eukprot:scaffold21.g2083.t1